MVTFLLGAAVLTTVYGVYHGVKKLLPEMTPIEQWLSLTVVLMLGAAVSYLIGEGIWTILN